jgi:hypothetical protein
MTGYFWDNNISAKYNMNEIKIIKSKTFNVYIMRKGALYYVCLTNEAKSTNKATEDSPYTREYFLEEKDFFNQIDRDDRNNLILPRPILEVSSFIRKQLEYLHL